MKTSQRILLLSLLALAGFEASANSAKPPALSSARQAIADAQRVTPGGIEELKRDQGNQTVDRDAGFTARFRRQQGGVFQEDVEILEAQQRSITANPQRRLKSFSMDAGGVKCRQIIDRLLAAQGSAPITSSAPVTKFPGSADPEATDAGSMPDPCGKAAARGRLPQQ